jgi:hypothetical protein
MTTGFAASTVNTWLDTLNGSWAKLHTGDPGAAGTANASSVTTRMQWTFSAASGGSKSATATFPSWTNWAGTNGEVVSHVSVWTASTAGTFLYSYALTASQTMNTGNTLAFTSHTASITPIAA